MTHPTEAELFALGLGRPESPDTEQHVQSCSHCRERVQTLAGNAAALRMSAGFRETRQRLVAGLERKRRRQRWWQLGGALSLLTAASVALLVTGGEEQEPRNRTKGSASVRVQRRSGETGPLRIGEHVSLRVASAGHPFALLLAVDESGDIEQIWPTEGAQSGRLPHGQAESILEPGFDVTPGSFTLHAFFSDKSLATAEAVHALRRQPATTGSDATKDLIPGVSVHVTTPVEVTSDR